MLTIKLFGISEEDWNQTPASVRAALMFLIQQNQRLENHCATYEPQVQKLQAELERLKKLELEVAELRECLGQNSQNSSKPHLHCSLSSAHLRYLRCWRCCNIDG
jgi:hypothetical protein